MVEANVQEKSALDYFGGFEDYQQRLYYVIANGVLNLTDGQLLEKNNSFQITNVPGFERGLVNFIKAPCYITCEMASCLEFPLNFSRISILEEPKQFSDEDRIYWNKRIKYGKSFSTGPKLTPEFLAVLSAIMESDRLAMEKNALGEKPKFKLVDLVK